ncbi:methyltransferase domain-containing protein [Pseudoalteromonas sp.]|uniref:methyltransferase domain-containing protein n=1 Tax=Pseudoalteromonas sp. TaxID=53249 RepID=UPI00257B4249|nr:methyltransferase domain-containing protein [Pseudoalteromonas sp.]
MIIIVYSAVNATSIEDFLGESEYSYYYVLREFMEVLKKFGIVVTVQNPETEVDAIYDNAQQHGQKCLFISFSPPHKSALNLRCPTILALAWEFSTIPTEYWMGDITQDWRYGLEKVGTAITHSNFAVEAIIKAMGDNYPVYSLPAPVWDRCEYSPCDPESIGDLKLNFAGSVADTLTANLEPFSPIHGGMPERRYLRNKFVSKRHPIEVSLSGILYFSVFNPADGRKNWVDMIDGFINAHRHHSDTTLVLKLVNNNVSKELRGMLRALNALKPYDCRVVILQGYIPDEEYQKLQRAMHFVVNTSLGEGQCLPLMELMSMGKPSLAPQHSSMLDYIHKGNAFIIDSHEELTFWPQDPRRAYRTMRSRIDAESVEKAFLDSYQVIKNHPDIYKKMCANAHETMRHHCSVDVITRRFAHILNDHPEYDFDKQAFLENSHLLDGEEQDPFAKLNFDAWQLESASSYETDRTTFDNSNQYSDSETGDELNEWMQQFEQYEEGIDSRLCGLEDAKVAGWFNYDSGELVPDFQINEHDIVIDVGCGEGPSSLFAAERGAEINYCDIEAEKVELVNKKLQSFDVKKQGFVCTAEEIPLPDSYATHVIAREVLEHLDDPKIALQELYRLGRPGAMYLITVPEATAENMQKSIGPVSHFEKPNHIQIFSREDFSELVLSVGLKIISHKFYGFYWSLWMNFLWTTQETPNEGATMDNINPPYHPLLTQWAHTWHLLLQKEKGHEVKQALDDLLPKTQVIIASKPTLAQ